jgi:transposase
LALVEVSVVEQRYQAVLMVQSGGRVTDVASRFGVSRQSVHAWLAAYRAAGLAGLQCQVSAAGVVSVAGRAGGGGGGV